MARFKLYIEYDGTNYSGWQVQGNAKTIQGEILKSAFKLFRTTEIDLQGSGRTDAGVHALMQVAHLEVNTMLAPEIIKLKLNKLLPSDINLVEVEKAANNFHARRNVNIRSYIYQISKRRTAFGKRYVWWIDENLAINKMQMAGHIFEGMHDFQSFTDDDKNEKSTKVLIDKIEVKDFDDLIIIRVKGSHFLWKMVRRIVGILVECGKGNLDENSITTYLKSYSNTPSKYTAPPSGLFLEQVIYNGEKFNSKLQSVTNLINYNK